MKVVGACISKAPYAFVMELLPEGNLADLLHSDQALPWDIRFIMIEDIAKGIKDLHSMFQKPVSHLLFKSPPS